MIDKWVLIALIAIILIGIFQFLIKLSSGKMDYITGAVFMQVAALAATISVLLIGRFSGWGMHYTMNGAMIAVAGGVLIGIANVLIFYIFYSGPIVRVAPILGLAMVVSVALGMLLLNETINLKIGAGIILAIAAILLLSS